MNEPAADAHVQTADYHDASGDRCKEDQLKKKTFMFLFAVKRCKIGCHFVVLLKNFKIYPTIIFSNVLIFIFCLESITNKASQGE